MKIICNSSPIIALSSVDKLNLLNDIFSEVIIPEAVFDEVFKAKNNNSDLCKPPFLNTVEVSNCDLVKSLNFRLGKGESEVIALSIERGINKVILDDKQARKIASNMGLSVIGTVGVLLLAKQKSLIINVADTLKKMKEKVNFRISQSIIELLDKE